MCMFFNEDNDLNVEFMCSVILVVSKYTVQLMELLLVQLCI
jgi:hypothetical protein